MIKLAREKVLRVRDVMSNGVITIQAGVSLAEAARCLTEHRISGAPVLSLAGKPIGIVSQSDLLDPRHQLVGAKVEDAMTRLLFAVRPTDSAMAAVRLMVSEDIRRAMVVGEDGRLVGVVTAMDILRALVKADPDEGIEIEFVDLGVPGRGVG